LVSRGKKNNNELLKNVIISNFKKPIGILCSIRLHTTILKQGVLSIMALAFL
jgi:hypothetical protein